MSKPDIVLIHGMSGTPTGWDDYRGVLEGRGYRTHAPVLRFHDRAPGAEPDPALATTSLLDYAADLEKIVRGLPQTPVLMGHSMGGLLAQMLAARGLARCAVLLTPAAPAGVNALTWSVVRTGWRVLTRWGFWHKPIVPRYDDSRWGVFNGVDEAEARRLFADMVPDSGRVAFEIGFPYLDSRRAAHVDPAAITCPLLVVGATLDRMTPAAVVRKIAARYGDKATYVEFPGHAHWVLGEPGWEKIVAHCADWIDRAVASQSTR